MFKILDVYILKKFLGTFVFTMLVITIIAVVIDTSEKADDFVRSLLVGGQGEVWRAHDTVTAAQTAKAQIPQIGSPTRTLVTASPTPANAGKAKARVHRRRAAAGPWLRSGPLTASSLSISSANTAFAVSTGHGGSSTDDSPSPCTPVITASSRAPS